MTARLAPDHEAANATSHDDLAARLAHLGTLRSAWTVLSAAGTTEHANEIGESGRALTEHLTTIVESHSDVSTAALTGIDNLLTEFETSIRYVATGLRIAQLRAALPRFRDSDRQGLLDLLDVLIGGNTSGKGSVAERIGAIDYLITLLCARGTTIGFDPVTLTPKLEALCRSLDDAGDPTLAEVEAEFFAAANLDARELAEELQQRTYRRRKVALGSAYFAPRVLRAIVTYNCALLAHVAEKILDSADWGDAFEQPSVSARPARKISVFDSKPLRAVARATRRRIEGKEPEPTAIDRIVWALDLDYLDPNERKALGSPALATPEDPLGTAILVGLLSRSLAVLSIELQEEGFDPDAISDEWVQELDEIFQDEINRNVSDDAYKVACALSELKNKFLFAPLAEHLREHRLSASPARSPAQPPDPGASIGDPGTAGSTAPDPKPESARQLVQDALDRDREGRDSKPVRLSVESVPWDRFGRIAAVVMVLVACTVFVLARDTDLDGFAKAELAAMSPYLEQGKRDGAGTGASFVGRVGEDWATLSSSEREATAREIVGRLRAEGMTRIIVFDDEERVRIQALGSQPIRVL